MEKQSEIVAQLARIDERLTSLEHKTDEMAQRFNKLDSIAETVAALTARVESRRMGVGAGIAIASVVLTLGSIILAYILR